MTLILAALYSACSSSAGYSVSPIASLLSAFTCSYGTEFINLGATAVCCVVLCRVVSCRVVLCCVALCCVVSCC